MQKAFVPILIAFLLLLAGVATYVVTSSEATTSTTIDLPVDTNADPAAKKTLSAPSLANGVDSADTTNERVEVADTTDKSDAQIPAAATSAIPSAMPTISGRVTDANGSPLAGADIVAAGTDFMPLDLVMANSSGENTQRWSTVTKEDGTFELQGPPAGDIRVGVRLAGFVPFQSVGLRLLEDEGKTFPDFTMQSSVILDGQVVLASGGPLEGAKIYVEEEGKLFHFERGVKERPIATSDNNGRFRIDELAAGPWHVRVEFDGLPNARFEGTTERAGDVESGLLFEMQRGLSIAGRVSGAPASSLEAGLTIAAHLGSARSMEMIGFGDRKESRKAKVNADGTFEIEGCLEDQEYTLGVFEGAVTGSPWDRVDNSRTQAANVRSGDRGVQLAWLGGTALEFQVFDAQTGSPLENFTVDYGRGMSTKMLNEDGQSLSTHPDGKVRLVDLVSDLRSGEFTLLLRSPGYKTLSRSFELAKGETLQAGAIALEVAPMITLEVVSAATGRPVAGASISINTGDELPGQVFMTIDTDGETVHSGDDRKVNYGTTDSNGIATLSSIEGETGKLTITHDDFTEYVLEDLVMPIGAPVNLRAELSIGGTVLVRALDASGAPIPGVRVESREAQPAVEQPSGGGSFSMQMGSSFGGPTTDSVTNTDGEVAFRHMPPGDHEFRISDEGNGVSQMTFSMPGMEDRGEPWTIVEVVEAAEHNLELRQQPRASLSGRVLEAGENLAGAVVNLVPESTAGSSPMMMVPGLTGIDSARTDGGGQYVIEGVKPGRYTVEISHPSRVMPANYPLEVSVGANEFAPDLPLAIIEGTIRDIHGEPLAGIQVEATKPGDDGPGGMVMISMVTTSDGGGGSAIQIQGGPDPGITDADGHYRLRGVEADTELVISASGDTAVPKSSEPFSVRPNQTKSGVDLTLSPAGSVLITLDGKSGFRMIRATYLGTEEGVEDKRSFAQEATASLTGMTPGTWEITVESIGPQEAAAVEPQQIDIKAGKQGTLTFTF